VTSRQVGYLCGFVAYVWWGLVPLYFRALDGVPAQEILAHRIAWSLPLVLALTALTGGWSSLRAAITHRRTVATMLLSALLLAGNWYLYIFATVTGRVAEASLGYYMMPLVNAFFGMVFLGERLRTAQWPALALIGVGVAIPMVASGDFTWIAVTLPITFGLYGLVRKVAAVESLAGLTVETFLLGIPSFGYIAWQIQTGKGVYGTDIRLTTLLMFGGVITVVPLLTYILSLRRLPLVAVSFIQFLSPTMQVLLAVYYFHEDVSNERWAALVCVLIAVTIFIVDAIIAARGNARSARIGSSPVAE
jgi:chloramphenicol-sensitive protein RarD